MSYVGCEEKITAYLDALISEMEEYQGEEIDTVFIGGGTPTIMSADELKRLISAIFENFKITDDAEFTVEANPGTLTEKKLKVMRESGVNRLSIGAQSFCNAELINIGRIHSVEEAKYAFSLARDAGFDNINLDIIFSVPGQTEASFSKTLDEVIELAPEHISCYSLILEECTPLFSEVESGKVVLPDEETDRKNYDLAREKLKKAGYIQYEISNFAKAGKMCRHNLKYWDASEYIGIGVAAHSYFREERFENTDNLDSYIRGKIDRIFEEKLTREDKISEFMIMGLRKTDGVSKSEFSMRFGSEINELFGDAIERFKKLGLLVENEDRIFLTPEGVNLSNSVLCEFV